MHGYQVKIPQKLMATHGSVSAFNPSKEDWTSYEERLRYYFFCKKRGHIVRVCRSKSVQRRPPRKTYYVEEEEDQETQEMVHIHCLL